MTNDSPVSISQKGKAMNYKGDSLKLVTFQSLGALKDLINKGYLECNEEYIDLRKAGVTYSWVLEKMDG